MAALKTGEVMIDEDHPLELARSELKRVNHLYYVSLKYTRTVDVVRNMYDRMIQCMGFLLDALLLHAHEKKDIEQIPKSTGVRAETLLKIYPQDGQLIEFINFYQLKRRIYRATFTRREEYRRHVTMISVLDNGDVVESSIDTLKADYEVVEHFYSLVKKRMYPQEDL